MTGLEFPGEIPFRDVYVHSVIQARDGRRMSKSLGTGIDPLEEIDVHGADALRFGLLAMSSTQDVRFSDAKVAAGPRPRQQALERQPADPPQRRRGRAGAAADLRRGPLDPLAAGADDRLGHREARDLRLRPRRRRRPTRSSGATSATGTWRSSSRASTTARRRSRRRCSTRWSGCWRCCTRRCRSSPRRSGASTRPPRPPRGPRRSRWPTRPSSTRRPRPTSRAGSC